MVWNALTAWAPETTGNGIEIDLDQPFPCAGCWWARMPVSLKELHGPARVIPFVVEHESQANLQHTFHGVLDVSQGFVFGAALAHSSGNLWGLGDDPPLIAPRQVNQKPNNPHQSTPIVCRPTKVLRAPSL